MDDIIIDKEFQALIPPLKVEEYALLEASIIDNKFDPAYPLILWKKTIIDGHNRYNICTKHNIKFTTIQKEFTSREAVLDWIYNNQLSRRNIDSFQKTYLIGMQYKNTKKIHGGDRKSSPQNEDLNKTAEKIGKQNNVGHSTVERAEVFADDVNSIAEKSDNEPQKILSILYSEVKSTRGDVKDVAELDTDELKLVLGWVEQKKFPNARIAIREYKKQNGGKRDVEPPVPPQPTQPEKNAHGVYSLIPEPVSARYAKVKLENLYPLNDELHCVITIDKKDEDCLIKPVAGEANNFFLQLPNIKYLIVDFSNIFKSMIPIVVNSTDERKDITYFRSFPDTQWDEFVEKHFPQLSRKKQEELKAYEKPFVLYVGKRDMGVIEKFNNDELKLAEQCHALPKEQEVTELWDNLKQKLIFTFKGEWKPEDITTTAEEKINEYLDAEETTEELIKPETKEAPKQEELDDLAKTILKILQEVGDLQIRPLIKQICERKNEKVPEDKNDYRALEARVRRRCDDLKGSMIEHKKVGPKTFFSVDMSSDNED